MLRSHGVLAVLLTVTSAGTTAAADDWTRIDNESGLVYYRCDAPRCSIGALLSCRTRKADVVPSLDRYRSAMTIQKDAWTEAGYVVDLGTATRTSIGSWVLYQHAYTVQQGVGVPTPFRGGFLAGAVDGISIVSSSKSAAVTKRNFDQMVTRLTSTTIDRAIRGCTVRPGSS